jgi:spermidine synthase
MLGHKPTSALDICFGMGTTFRSLMSWGINATAVELVPSVKEAFPYYFDDAREVMSRPNGKIVIDDGRRFLRRTQETFDVITLDPPPPVEAAGSSLLYSNEFYAAVKARLKAGGILQQWMPNTKGRTVQAVVNSLLESFSYVKMYVSHEGWGHHFLASMSPIETPSPEVLASRLPELAKADLVEWVKEKDPKTFLGLVLGSEEDPHAFVRDAGSIHITDDGPYNEYYVMREIAGAR